MSTTGLLLISSMILISSVAADDTMSTTTSADSETATVTASGTDISTTTTSADGSTTSTGTDSSTTETETEDSVGDSTQLTTGDRNNDGVIDAFEKCAFVEERTEAECSAVKEEMKKRMWEMYGQGTYNPNAFQRNEKGGIIIKEMFQMKKNMQSEIKDMRRDAKEQVREKKEELKQIKKHLSEKLRGQLLTALDKIATEKKETMFKKVLVNIDRAVTKITTSSMTEERKTHMLAQLAEIKAIVQEKLDALSGNTTESNILQDVLSGTGE